MSAALPNLVGTVVLAGLTTTTTQQKRQQMVSCPSFVLFCHWPIGPTFLCGGGAPCFKSTLDWLTSTRGGMSSDVLKSHSTYQIHVS